MGDYGIAHGDGNLANALTLRRVTRRFRTTSDTETIVQLMVAKSKGGEI